MSDVVRESVAGGKITKKSPNIQTTIKNPPHQNMIKWIGSSFFLLLMVKDADNCKVKHLNVRKFLTRDHL